MQGARNPSGGGTRRTARGSRYLPVLTRGLLPGGGSVVLGVFLDDAETPVGLEVAALHVRDVLDPLLAELLGQVVHRQHLLPQVAPMDAALRDEQQRWGMEQPVGPGIPEAERVEGVVPREDRATRTSPSVIEW